MIESGRARPGAASRSGTARQVTAHVRWRTEQCFFDHRKYNSSFWQDTGEHWRRRDERWNTGTLQVRLAPQASVPWRLASPGSRLWLTTALTDLRPLNENSEAMWQPRRPLAGAPKAYAALQLG